ncbi:MAG: hypothetical protein ACR2L2_17125 [Acidobacteriota bacterium]
MGSLKPFAVSAIAMGGEDPLPAVAALNCGGMLGFMNAPAFMAPTH